MPLAEAMWGMWLELAPWLLAGLAIAGVLHVALPSRFVGARLRGAKGVLWAVAVGVPLPLCSCGVIPAGVGLRKDGAGRGPVVGFLISTPQTGVDSILVSASLLGWPFALFKVAAAAVTGVIGGLATEAAVPSGQRDAIGNEAPVERRTWRDGVDHALDTLRSIQGWLVVGVVVSALIERFVPPAFWSGLSDMGSAVPALAALVVSLPLYVCATASVPIATALVAGGMPAGAALVFLMAGPATNVATIGAISRALGPRALSVYLTTIVGGSLLAGFLFDALIDASPTVPAHHDHASPWRVAAAAILAGLVAWLWLHGLARPVTRPSTIVGVDGLTCGSCVAKLERALANVAGIERASVSLEAGEARIVGTAEDAAIRAAIVAAGFRPRPTSTD